jgi:hypothetical protein
MSFPFFGGQVFGTIGVVGPAPKSSLGNLAIRGHRRRDRFVADLAHGDSSGLESVSLATQYPRSSGSRLSGAVGAPGAERSARGVGKP